MPSKPLSVQEGYTDSSPLEINNMPGDTAEKVEDKIKGQEEIEEQEKEKRGWRFYGAFGCLACLNLICAIDATILSVALPVW